MSLILNYFITELIKKGYDRATKIIHNHKELHEKIVSKLLEEGILIGTELDKICKEFEENQKIKHAKRRKKQI